VGYKQNRSLNVPFVQTRSSSQVSPISRRLRPHSISAFSTLN